eukprot:4224022-Pleurochrysis_carterae.AAC.1
MTTSPGIVSSSAAVLSHVSAVQTALALDIVGCAKVDNPTINNLVQARPQYDRNMVWYDATAKKL